MLRSLDISRSTTVHNGASDSRRYFPIQKLHNWSGETKRRFFLPRSAGKMSITSKPRLHVSWKAVHREHHRR